MGNGNGAAERSAYFSYEGPKHHFHSVLKRWRLLVVIIIGTSTILGVLGSAVVWGGNQIWYSQKKATQHKEVMTGQIEDVRNSLQTVQNQIGSLQVQVSQFIKETRRERLEDRLAQTEMDINRFQRQIEQDGSSARPNDVTQLQRLRSKRDQIKRELERLYRYGGQ